MKIFTIANVVFCFCVWTFSYSCPAGTKYHFKDAAARIGDLVAAWNKKQITCIELSYNKIHQVGSNLFPQFPQLIHLQLRRIKQIPPGSFKGTKISYLNLSNNKLACVPDLNGIRKTLTFIDVSGNKITNNCGTNIGVIFPNLKKIYAQSNNFAGLPIMIVNAPNIERIDISYNNLVDMKEISDLKKDKHCSIIITIQLTGNQIMSIYKDSISDFPKLVSLILRNNKITDISEGAFSGTIIRILVLADNQISCVPDMRDIHKILRVLNLHKNNLHLCTSDESKDIPEFPALRSLTLSRNRLTKLPAIVYKVPNLRSLNIEGNNLMIVSDLSFIKTLANLYLAPSTVSCHSENEWLCKRKHRSLSGQHLQLMCRRDFVNQGCDKFVELCALKRHPSCLTPEPRKNTKPIVTSIMDFAWTKTTNFRNYSWPKKILKRGKPAPENAMDMVTTFVNITRSTDSGGRFYINPICSIICLAIAF